VERDLDRQRAELDREALVRPVDLADAAVLLEPRDPDVVVLPDVREELAAPLRDGLELVFLAEQALEGGDVAGEGARHVLERVQVRARGLLELREVARELGVRLGLEPRLLALRAL